MAAPSLAAPPVTPAPLPPLGGGGAAAAAGGTAAAAGAMGKDPYAGGARPRSAAEARAALAAFVAQQEARLEQAEFDSRARIEERQMAMDRAVAAFETETDQLALQVDNPYAASSLPPLPQFAVGGQTKAPSAPRNPAVSDAWNAWAAEHGVGAFGWDPAEAAARAPAPAPSPPPLPPDAPAPADMLPPVSGPSAAPPSGAPVRRAGLRAWSGFDGQPLPVLPGAPVQPRPPVKTEPGKRRRGREALRDVPRYAHGGGAAPNAIVGEGQVPTRGKGGADYRAELVIVDRPDGGQQVYHAEGPLAAALPPGAKIFPVQKQNEALARAFPPLPAAPVRRAGSGFALGGRLPRYAEGGDFGAVGGAGPRGGAGGVKPVPPPAATLPPITTADPANPPPSGYRPGSGSGYPPPTYPGFPAFPSWPGPSARNLPPPEGPRGNLTEYRNLSPFEQLRLDQYLRHQGQLGGIADLEFALRRSAPMGRQMSTFYG